MRVLERIQTKGYFWLPRNPEEELPGELHISGLGQIELSLMGVFDDPEQDGTGAAKAFLGHLDEIDRICGRTYEGGYVTLINCLRTRVKTNLAPGKYLNSSVFIATFALVGVDLDEDEVAFSKLNFTVEGLDDWLRFETFKHSARMEANDGDGKTELLRKGTVDYFTRSSPLFTLNDGINVQFHSPVLNDLSRHPSISLSLRPQPYISLISIKPQHFKCFIDLADRIQKFISLAVDQEVQFQSFTFLDDSLDQKVPIQMFFQTRASRKPEYRHRIQKVLFALPDIEDQFENMMNSWIKLFEQGNAGPALNLYFAAAWKETDLLDTNTLFLTQAIEILHRQTLPQNKPMNQKVFRKMINEFFDSTSVQIPELIKLKIRQANQPSLRDRVDEALAPFGSWFRDNEHDKDFAKRVSDTRNYFTHYPRHLKGNYQDSEQLMSLHIKLEVLLLLHILQLVGFNESQLSQIISNSQRLGKTLRAPRQ